MTVPVPLTAFDHAKAHAVRPRFDHKPLDRSRLVSLGLTLAFHAAAVMGLLAMVHVSHVTIPKVLTVQINLDKPKPKTDDLPPPPTLVQPTVVTMPMPEVPPVAPAPVITAAPPVPTKPVSPVSAPGPKAENGQAREDFVARLLAQLNHYKQYPRAARQARIQGVVMLHFVMDAQGRVLQADIAKSSGRPILDQEVLALIRRAQPLPALPADFPTRTLDAVVPVEFSLNG
jgi:protein TonB